MGVNEMEIKPYKSKFGDEIFCLIRLDPGETKDDILKNDQKIREYCLKLCQDEDEADVVIDSPIALIPKAGDYYVIQFLFQ